MIRYVLTKITNNPIYVFPLYWIVAGILDLVALISDRSEILNSPSLSNLPDPIEFTIAIFFVLSGVLIILPMLIHPDNLAIEWAAEKVGWILGASAWGSYAVVVLSNNPHAVLSWGSGLTIAVASVFRINGLRNLEGSIRADVEKNGS